MPKSAAVTDVHAPRKAAARAKGLGPSPRAQKKAKAEAAEPALSPEEKKRRANNERTRAWRQRKKDEAAAAAAPKAPAAPGPYPVTKAAPTSAPVARVVLSLPIAPGAKAAAGQIKSTLALAVASYKAQLRTVDKDQYARVEGTLTGLEMAKALCEMLQE